MDLKTALRRIKPKKKEEKAMKRLSDKIMKVSEKLAENFKPMICGSVAKGTWLSNKNEIDLFLLFSPSLPRKKLEEEGLKAAKSIIKKLRGKYEIAYAEHPYLRGHARKYQIDIVPCYDIKNPEKIQSAVDRTPHHVRYIKQNLLYPDEVRLLKQFCMANRVYGADVKTLGFSGYLCELLILKYGGFQDLVREASKWRAGHVIIFTEIDKKHAIQKFKNPLIVIDPIDRNRNVAAAVSVESFYKFVKACKEYMRRPSIEFFFPKKIKPPSVREIAKKIQSRGTEFFVLEFKRPDVVDDVLYPQARRFLNNLESVLKNNDLRLHRKDFFSNKTCYLILEFDIWKVPKIDKNIGPNIFSKHAEEFLKHYKKAKVFIENENWVVEKERQFTDALSFLKDFFSKNENEMLKNGVPNNLVKTLKKIKITSGKKLSIVLKDKGFRAFMKEYFEKDLNVI